MKLQTTTAPPLTANRLLYAVLFFGAWAINKFINYEIRLNNKQS